MRVLAPTVLVLALIGVFGAAPALADTQSSSNWSGYAVHGGGVRFRSVTGQWHVPAVSCTSIDPTYSAMWVGLGGYSADSPALEQTGTESDCDGYRHPAYTAWYELVPAPSHGIAMAVHPGDLMRATVGVTGKRVRLTLSDLTRHRSFTRTATVSSIDVSSAEWILEAPAACSSAGSGCTTLPLADFGQAAFSAARATSLSGRGGAISASRWHTTRITLTGAGRRFVSGGPALDDGGATPGSLTNQGSSFTLRYIAASAPPFALDSQVVSSAALRH